MQVGRAPKTLQSAIKRGRQRMIFDKRTFDAMVQQHKLYAFTVAGQLTNDGISSILQQAQTAIRNGRSYDAFKEALPADVFDRIVAPEVVIGNAATNVYQRARFNQQTRLKKIRPYWQYWTMLDRRVRPNHMVMHGITAPADSTFWKNNYPPNGHLCRCAARAYSSRQINSRGIKVYKTQAQVDQAVFNAQRQAGIPESKLVRPIADKGWVGSFVPEGAPVSTIVNALAKYQAGKYKSQLTPDPIPVTRIKEAAAAKKEDLAAAARIRRPAKLDKIYQDARAEVATVNKHIDAEIKKYARRHNIRLRDFTPEQRRQYREQYYRWYVQDKYGFEAEKFVHNLSQQWVGQSNGDGGTAWQLILEKTRGQRLHIYSRDVAKRPDIGKTLFKRWQTDPKNQKALALREEWERQFIPKGKTRVYRGIRDDQAEAIIKRIERDGFAEINTNGLSSWTEVKTKADGFAAPLEEGKRGITIRIDADPEDIYTSWHSNPVLNEFGEKEVVRIGKTTRLTRDNITIITD